MPSHVEQPTSRLLAWISWFEVVLAGGLLLFGLFLYFAWATDHSDHGERAFLFVGAYFIAPVGLALVIAGRLLQRGSAWAQWMIPIVMVTEVVLSRQFLPWP